MTRIDILYLQPVRINKLIGTVFHVFLFFSFFSVNAVLQLHTDVSTFYSIVAMVLCVVLFAP